MLKLLIADDEHRVCQLIEHLIPWEEFGLEHAGTAYNGIDAFDMIREIQPDIVITDIRMPGYDGLTLIEKSKALNSTISFIIVSGHRDFEYARNALKYGAEDYILKPLSTDELVRILRKIISRKNSAIQAAEELNKSKKILKKELMKDIMSREFSIDGEMIRIMEEDYSVCFNGPYFQVCIIQADFLDQTGDLEQYGMAENILERVETIISAALIDRELEFLWGFNRGGLVYLWETTSPSGFTPGEIENLYETSSRKISGYGNWRVTFCLGDCYSDRENAKKSYKEAEYVRKNRIFQGIGKVSRMKEDLRVSVEMPPISFTELDNAVKRVLQEEDLAGLRNAFSSFFTPVTRQFSNPETLCGFYRKVTDHMLDQFRTLGVPGKSREQAKSKAESILYLSHTQRLMESRLIDLYLHLGEDALSSRKVRDNKPIRIAKEYIEKHYKEPIDLNAVAAASGLNPIYFSALFKRETGTNFKDYLVEQRVEKAKELLVSGNETIQAISQEVGYRDSRYFSKIFTRTVGLKPHMYRKIHG